jgi:hypothetical protein
MAVPFGRFAARCSRLTGWGSGGWPVVSVYLRTCVLVLVGLEAATACGRFGRGVPCCTGWILTAGAGREGGLLELTDWVWGHVTVS